MEESTTKKLTLDDKVDILIEKVDGNTKNIDSLTDTLSEFMGFVRDNMATKDDIEDLRKEVKGDSATLRTELKGEMAEMKEEIGDLRLEMQAGFRGIEKELMDIKASLDRLEKKTQEDDDATVQEIFLLKKRVAQVEKELVLLKKDQKHHVTHST
ncbi:MAG: hypothetical protein CO029_01920 [Candidatus Magasanikbacteria bacterium CG_4_9_14_0_2_um_filter_41_10]|uniref:Uncharacterized protein n=1 Tax=Candidatus Magasanikbacteria bacterium CG_4_10_14_0_2_um_filter_41_31 TaxID=1974639 RepID=A0A2M7V5A8_9BACT|nr:MAG: hypothetical protein AUJ37_02050 [Candidatus Magasanikbacteria bacterium CG1_02_41_34]PIZ93775.1 MAG: hypothetical protein COX83_00950 [Candidatus Magasanikbacteria bacterium CG_4_10_14_0_2_um_filter_41_31]PJC53593.1 MAG: hypothetical protein CO029_01920 [Candidatus Magasanikbacteria bacterium CG_4_9_14_0_2_um_filter_41_10]